MSGLTEAELWERCGTSAEGIQRLCRVGIVVPADDGSFRVGDITRVRLAEAFERSGIALEALGEAIARGHLSFSFVDLLFPEPIAYTSKTYGQMCAETGFSPGLVERVHEAIGLPQPSMDDLVREDDAVMFSVGQMVLGLGMDEASVGRVLRVYAENIRRITQAEPSFYHAYVEEPMLHSGMTEAQMRETATQMNPLLNANVERLIMWLYRRHQEHYTTEHLVEHVEAAMEDAGLAPARPVRPPAMAFLDLTGYTRLTEQRGDEAAAELAGNLADLVQRSSQAHGGRPVKWLGDGVMFHFPDPGEGVVSCLEMADRVPDAGLPPAHIGVNAGPVVFRDGDYYGRTVNVAARIAGRAGPGEVLVSADVVRVAEPPDVRFEEVGRASLKGVGSPVVLYRAHRPA